MGEGGGGQGGTFPPNIFKIIKSLLEKVSCAPPPNIEALMVPPPISKLLRDPFLNFLLGDFKEPTHFLKRLWYSRCSGLSTEEHKVLYASDRNHCGDLAITLYH